MKQVLETCLNHSYLTTNLFVVAFDAVENVDVTGGNNAVVLNAENDVSKFDKFPFSTLDGAQSCFAALHPLLVK